MSEELTTAQLIVDILSNVIPLTPDQIWVYNEKREIPPVKGVYAVVGYVSVKPYGFSKTQTADSSGLVEDRGVAVQEQMYIKLFSADYSAVRMLPSFLGALSSNYSQQLQETWGFKLANIPVSVPETSAIDGSGIVRQFVITLNALRGYNNTGNIPYYDTFTYPTIPYKEG
jgi:hypothetical protein